MPVPKPYEMIIHALQILRQALNAYLDDLDTTDNDKVVLGNISQIELPKESDNSKNKVVMTLVNIREEKTLKNAPNYRRNDATLKTEYFNPPVFLNLYLLVAACQDDYTNALIYLSRIASFFQSKNVFTHSNTVPVAGPTLVADNEKMETFKIILDLYSPSFEEQNHIWGTLGGKQLPSLVYVARLIEVTPKKLTATGGVVEEIVTRFNGVKTDS